MQDPWDYGLANWKLQNIDDVHFYQMSYPQVDKKPGLLARVQLYVRREWIILLCRLQTFTLSPSLMVEQQCDCLEG